MKLKNARLAAFGSTRRAGIKANEDANLKALLGAGTPVVTIFGKSWDFHVTDIIKTSLEENLNMIHDTISFLISQDKEVIFDAEHFFDGYKANPDYALRTLKVAKEAGASCLVLCDTNGGSFPDEIGQIVAKVASQLDVPLGIHCHNDGGMAVANSIMAVENGAIQVQGTINGFGERCGNANLSTIIPNLQLKRGYFCVPEDQMKRLVDLSRYVSELANLAPDERAPYVGRFLFLL
jgi:2-isopropylmalate synthase